MDRERVVVLCGAGVSVAAPSSVPSWWGFNQSVLEELIRRFTDVHPVPVRATSALSRLSLDALDITEFSQILSDAFAGGTWFEALGVLDGTDPNENHYALARWAASGPLKVVATTNFDTLIERAMLEVGIAHRVYDCLLDDPPTSLETASAVCVVKLHGSTPRSTSLVDLAAQKRRGLPGAWLDWLESVFGKLEVVVAGFSGADLALAEDYLRLRVASAHSPSLTWLVRPGQRPLASAAEIVRLNGDRGRFAEGDLPSAWSTLGAPDYRPSPTRRHEHDLLAEDEHPNVSAALDKWLEHPMVDADTCGMALTRLLDAAGMRSAAAALRTSIRTRVRRNLRAGVDLTGAIRAAHQIGQLASDEPPARAAQAISGLNLSSRALDAALDHFPPDSQEKETVRLEVAHFRATNLGNVAYFEVLRGRLTEAAAAVAQAARFSAVLSGTRRMNHDAAQLEVSGAIAYLNGDTTQAWRSWNSAHELAKSTGHLSRVKTTAENLRRLGGPPDA